MGCDASGRVVELDLEELLATRLLVQGNSGSGKSHLLRRLIEGSAELVQQVVIDPEGDFVTLADAYGHVPLDASGYSLIEVARFAERAREHRASVVLNLEGLEADEQMRSAATFIAALFDAPREHWYPVLVVVDEAQLFAPAAAGDVSEEARRASLTAMTNLMCRGRKRGLAGVIATQRLAKLAKNVAAEASNFLMGRTFLDIDMARAADLLGMERRQADMIRDLARGEFLALGPALSRRPVNVRIGPVATVARTSSPKLIPLPTPADGDAQQRLFAADDGPPPPPPSRPAPTPADQVESRPHRRSRRARPRRRGTGTSACRSGAADRGRTRATARRAALWGLRSALPDARTARSRAAGPVPPASRDGPRRSRSRRRLGRALGARVVFARGHVGPVPWYRACRRRG